MFIYFMGCKVSLSRICFIKSVSDTFPWSSFFLSLILPHTHRRSYWSPRVVTVTCLFVCKDLLTLPYIFPQFTVQLEYSVHVPYCSVINNQRIQQHITSLQQTVTTTALPSLVLRQYILLSLNSAIIIYKNYIRIMLKIIGTKSTLYCRYYVS